MKTGGEVLLLDTHLWYWYVMGEDQRTSRKAWEIVVDAITGKSAGVSEITFWELAVKARKRQFQLSPDPRTWLRKAREIAGVGVIQIDRKVLVDSALLDMSNRDPADCILVATAQRYNMRLATADEDIIRYAETNPTLQVLDIRP